MKEKILDLLREMTNDSKSVSYEAEKELCNILTEVINKLHTIEEKVGCYIKSVSPNELNWILQQVVEAFGEYEYIGHCDQCCDIIYKYTLEI